MDLATAEDHRELVSQRSQVPSILADRQATAIRDIAAVMNALLADACALHLKTKIFQWHISGPHFSEYQRLLGDQAGQIASMLDPIAERIRKIGGSALRSLEKIAAGRRIPDSESVPVEPSEILMELRNDNAILAQYLREAHAVCAEHHDLASMARITCWIDETETRSWFLFESSRAPNPNPPHLLKEISL